MIPTSRSSGWSDEPVSATTTEESASASATAKASVVAAAAKDSAADTAATATEQGKQVVGEAAAQARHLAAEAREQVRQQAAEQQQKVAHGLRALADEMATMAERGGQSGMATEVVRQASSQARTAADWLEQRQPGDLVNELNRLGRRRPGTFLAGAAIAGVLAGRLTRGIAASGRDETAAARAPEASTPWVPTQSGSAGGPTVPEPGSYASEPSTIVPPEPTYGDPLTDPARGRGDLP